MKSTRRQLPDRSDIALTPMVVPSPAGGTDDAGGDGESNTAPVNHKIEWIDITRIKTDGGTQMRDGLNQERVNEYAEEMAEVRSWGKFPHVVVFYDGTNYWLADGFHRVAAAARMPLIVPTVLAEVNAGTRRDAILYAAGANASHGLPRTAADKRRAIETLLRDEEWSKWSDREIGRRCAVSRTTVGTVRAELSLSNLDSESAGERTYITRHGTEATMKVGNIGRVVYTEPTPSVPTAEIENLPITDYGEQYAPLAELGFGLQKARSGYRWVWWATAQDDVPMATGEWLAYPQAACEAAVKFHSRGMTPPQPEGKEADDLAGKASVEAIQEAVRAWVATVTKDVDNQNYYLRNLQEGRQESSLYQLIGHMQRVSQIHAYRDEDLTEAIRIEMEDRARQRAEKEAKRGPKPPDEWMLKNAIETWLAGKGLKSVPQRNLIVELREKEEKHPDYAEMAATLPEHWRRRELNRALSSLADSLGWKVGHDEWEAVQLPSGRWYARDKSRNPQTTVSFETEAEALSAIERADDKLSRFYGDLEATINSPSEPWGLKDFFKNAPADVIAEAKVGLEKLAALGDAPSYVAERLQRIEKRVEDAQRLLQVAMPQRPPDAQPEADEWASGAVSLDRDWSAEELADYAAANQVVISKPNTVTITLDRDIAQKLHAALLAGAMRFNLDTLALTEIKRAVGEAIKEGIAP